MFEVFLLMVAVAAQSMPGPSTGAALVPQAAATAPSLGAQSETPSEAAGDDAPPAFLSPDPDDEQPADAPPAFLSPGDEPVLVAEPQEPTGRFTTATEVKPILTATRNAWISVRDFNGKDLLYVTHLWSWRCGLLDLKIGINGDAPERWPLPDCHMDQQMPAAILDSDGLPFREFPQGSIAMIEVEITYDDLSTDRAKFNRMGVEIE